MSQFKEKVIEIVRMIPAGKVVSYGQMAAYAGAPRAAREVGWTLKETKVDIPWWRVINNAWKISIEGNFQADKPLQAKLLMSEGIDVSDDFTLDIEKYRWRPSIEEIRPLQLPEEYLQEI